MARRKMLLVGVAGLVAVSVGGGFVAARRISSPADEAAKAKPPTAGPVTAPLEQRTLHSEIVTRGDAKFDDAIDLRVDTSHVGGSPVMTSDPPEVGTLITEGIAMFEIGGRPVIAMVGALPTYRDLAPDDVGPDVAQLEVALQRLGFDPGTVDENFDGGTSAAVEELYQHLGFGPPVVAAAIQQRQVDATAALAVAKDAVSAAYIALADAMKGPKESEKLTLDSAVKTAQRALTIAQLGADPGAVAAANEQLQIAKAQRTEGLAPPDVSKEEAALAEAQARQESARADVVSTTAAAAAPMPAAELVFVPSLPRRVDSVAFGRGHVVDGPVMSISGSTVVVTTALPADDRQLVAVGMSVTIAPPTGDPMQGTVQSLTDSTATTNPGGVDAIIALTTPTDAQITVIRGSNVKVTIPIASTKGDVLCAPLAALSAGAGGESRVEVATVDGGSRLITVTVGLVAEGFAEVEDPTGALQAGDLVVVGR